MITHNLAFEALAKAPVKRTDVIVTRQIGQESGGYIDGTPVFQSSTSLMKVTIDAIGVMLGTVTKKATAQLLGIQNDVKAGDVYKIQLGLLDGSAYNYISQGMYIVDTIAYNYDAGSTTITMYDAMWTASKKLYTDAVTDGDITYPLSVEDYAYYIAGLLGVEVDSSIASLPNSQYQIQEELYSTIKGATLANVIQDIAGATGTTARMRDNTLTFTLYNPLSETLDSDTLKELKIGDTYGPITSVVLGRVPQNDNVAINATIPQEREVTDYEPAQDLFTVPEHNMLVGNMIQFTSVAPLPAPLDKDKFYYVTNTNASQFQISTSYSGALAGTDIVNLTEYGTSYLFLKPITPREIQINNNEILDDTRQERLPSLYNNLSGIYWSDVKAKTIGLGWHEVGDVINFTQGSTTVRAFLSEVHLVLAGSITENLVSTVPTIAAINYQSAGGVIKSVYNTEIKVDKQQNEITSVVSRQDNFEGTTLNTFTQIRQDIDDISLTVQKAGGGNLLDNSVGYATDGAVDANGVNYQKLLSWNYNPNYSVANNGAVTSDDSSESQNYGGVSGRLIKMASDTGEIVSITQRVNVAVNTSLSFGLRVRNVQGTGGATITISNTNDSRTITIPSTQSYVWEEFKLENFTSTMSWLDIKIESSATAFRFTDLRLLYGQTLQGWVQSNTEILSTNVQFSVDGMRIFDSIHDTETRVTYNEFSTRRKTDGVVLFEADDSGVVTNDLKIKGSTSYNDGDEVVIKQITIPKSSELGGIAFVKG